MEVLVMESSSRKSGPELSDTLTSMGKLGSTNSKEGYLERSGKLTRAGDADENEIDIKRASQAHLLLLAT